MERERKIMNEIQAISQTVIDLQIQDEESFSVMGTYLTSCVRYRKEVTAYHEESIEAAHKTHKILTGKRKEELDFIGTIEALIRSKRSAYKAEQDRIVREAQEKAEAEEHKKADEERERLLEKAANTEDTETQEALVEKAEQVVAAPVFTPKTIQKTTAMTGGGSSTFVEDIEIVVDNPQLILKTIVDGGLPLNIIEIKESRLKSWVKMHGIKQGQQYGFTVRKTQRERLRV